MQLHCHSFLLLLIKLIDFSYKTAFPPFYCIISPHPRKLGTNLLVCIMEYYPNNAEP
mgnify:FL=1|jgi:hypothetical protein